MTIAPRASAVLTVLVLVTTGIAAQAQSPQPAPTPELTTLLGKPVFARPDTDGAIAKADAALAADPRNVTLILAAARARDAALQFHAAVEVYTRGLAVAPQDVRLLRFRGHRYISIRRFDLAVADLQKAAALAPWSFDVAYHLALAHYLRGEYADAARVYRACLDGTTGSGPLPEGWRSCANTRTTDNDRVAVSDWLYRALRRAGRVDEARALAAAIPAEMKVGENEAYYTALRFYAGAVTEDVAMTPQTKNENRLVTVGYGIATYYLASGETARACALLRRIANEPNWNAFGVIAAEVDLSRTPEVCPSGTQPPAAGPGPQAAHTAGEHAADGQEAEHEADEHEAKLEAEFVASNIFQSGPFSVRLAATSLLLDLHYYRIEENEIGIVGLSWEFRLHPLRVIPGMGWAFGQENRPAPVVSLRWHGAGERWLTQGAWVKALRAGVLPAGESHQADDPHGNGDEAGRYPTVLEGHVSGVAGALELGPFFEHIGYRHENEWKGGGRAAWRLPQSFKVVSQFLAPDPEFRMGLAWEP